MFSFKKVALIAALMLSSSSSASASMKVRDGAADDKHEAVEYMQKMGHNPNLSPEQIMQQHHLAEAKTTKTKTNNKKNEKATLHVMEQPKTEAEPTAAHKEDMYANRQQYNNEVVDHVNLRGHNPNLSPEQIYEMIRRAKNEHKNA